MTRMACPDMQYEDAFVKMLDEVDRFEIKGAELTLFDDHKALAVFKAVEKERLRSVQFRRRRNICGSPRRGCRFFCIRRNETTVWWRTAPGMDAGNSRTAGCGSYVAGGGISFYGRMRGAARAKKNGGRKK